MRTLTIIPLVLALLSACADVQPDDVRVETGALSVSGLVAAPAIQGISLEVAMTPQLHKLVPVPSDSLDRPGNGLRESHVAPSFKPGCNVSVRFAGTFGGHEEIDGFRLPSCLRDAPTLTSLLPLVLAQYGEDLTWTGAPVDEDTLLEEGLVTVAQLDAMDAAAGHNEHVEYYVASSGCHTLIIAYYPDQGRLFGIIVTVGDGDPRKP